MSFISTPYFVGEINIPTLPTTDNSLTQAITQYEREILISLFGTKLYSLLIADLTLGEPQTQKYIDLVDGADFILPYGGIDYSLTWNGLRNTDLLSLIAYYTFYKYIERDVTRFYGSGVSMSPDGNGWVRVSPQNKMINAWERMRELYGVVSYQYRSPVLGSEVSYAFNADPSAFNFLFVNQADYPDWIFTPIKSINVFNI